MKEKEIAPCKQCKKETYNETSDWSGFCSKQCQADYGYAQNE